MGQVLKYLKRAMRVSLLLSAALGCLLAGCAGPTAVPQPPVTAPPPEASLLPSPTFSATRTEAATATEEAVCLQMGGTLQEESYESPLLGREVAINLYTPPCYEVGDEPIPSVYFLHGKPFNETHWPSLGLLAQYEQGLRERRWREALLVFPRVPEPLFSETDGGPGSYEAEFMETVVPAVEGRFPKAQGGQRALVGISRGAIWALEIGMRHPEEFGAVAGLSPSLAVNYPRPSYDPMDLAAEASVLPDRILLLAGEEDWARPQTEELAERLATGPTRLQVSVVPGDHADPTWSESLPLVLDFLLGASN